MYIAITIKKLLTWIMYSLCRSSTVYVMMIIRSMTRLATKEEDTCYNTLLTTGITFNKIMQRHTVPYCSSVTVKSTTINPYHQAKYTRLALNRLKYQKWLKFTMHAKWVASPGDFFSKLNKSTWH